MHSEAFFYEGHGQLEDRDVERLDHLEKEIALSLLFKSKLSPRDISVEEAAKWYFRTLMKGETQLVKDLANYLLEEYGNVEGSDLWKLSARMVQFD
jgi:hypothetical protein